MVVYPLLVICFDSYQLCLQLRLNLLPVSCALTLLEVNERGSVYELWLPVRKSTSRVPLWARLVRFAENHAATA